MYEYVWSTRTLLVNSMYMYILLHYCTSTNIIPSTSNAMLLYVIRVYLSFTLCLSPPYRFVTEYASESILILKQFQFVYYAFTSINEFQNA